MGKEGSSFSWQRRIGESSDYKYKTTPADEETPDIEEYYSIKNRTPTHQIESKLSLNMD